MKKPSQRLKTEIDTGGGPNGEDIIRLIDTATGNVVKEEMRKSEEQPLTNRDESTSTTSEVSASSERLISAQEMLQLAIKEREETFGRRVKEIINHILQECKEVILNGKLTYQLDNTVSLEVGNGVVKELKRLGYKVQKQAEPGEHEPTIFLTVGWPTKLTKATKIKKAVVIEEPTPTKKSRKRKVKATGTEVPEDDTPTEGILFTKEKPMQGRPPRPNYGSSKKRTE